MTEDSNQARLLVSAAMKPVPTAPVARVDRCGRMTRVQVLRICLLAFAVSTIWGGAIPSLAGASLVIKNDFTGAGALKITLEQEGIKDSVDCTGSTLKGTVSNPADAKAKLSSWTMTGCTASSGGESFGSATVTVLYSLPAVEALSTNSVKVGPLTVRAEYKVHGSTCRPEVIMGNYNYNYTNGSLTNQLSAKVPHIFGIPEGFPPPECLDNGIGYFEPSFSFTNPQFEVEEVKAPVCDSLSVSRIKIGDMNGDGKADIFRFTEVADGIGEAQVWRSEGRSFTPLGRVNTGFGLAYEDRLADWDGDGDDDVFQFTETGRVDGWRSNGTSYTQLSQVGSGFANPCETRIGDINGDGKDDILRFSNEGNGYAWTSNGTPNNYTYKGLIATGFGHSNEVKVGDFNGDGYDDLFQFTNEGNGYLWRNNGGTSFTYLGKFASGFGGPNEVRIGDMNGDGRDDLFRFSEEGNGYYWLSNGDGTFTYMGNFTSGFGPSRQVRIADINGDSKADILWFRIENGNGYAWLGNGKGGFESLGQIGTGFGNP